MLFKDLLYDWINYSKDRVKLRTYNRYLNIIELHLIPEYGDVSINNIKRKNIYDFLQKHKASGNLKTGKEMSSSSVNLILTVFNMVFEYALDLELCEYNPCARLKRFPSVEKKVDAFTRQEQLLIEEYVISSYDRRCFGILFTLYTGLRIGELLALRWDDFDFEIGIIKINKTRYREKDETGKYKSIIDSPKTNSSDRIIPIPSCILDYLLEYKKSSMSSYFIESKDGTEMPIRTYQHIFERTIEYLKISHLSFHALRHTFATRAIECGMDIKTLSEIMGHKNASITLNRYAHCMLETKVKMMNKLDLLDEKKRR